MESWCDLLELVQPIDYVSVTTASMQIPCLLAVHAPNAVTNGWPGSMYSTVGSLVHSLIEKLAALPAERHSLINNPSLLQDYLSAYLRNNSFDVQQLGMLWQSSIRSLRRALNSIPDSYEPPEDSEDSNDLRKKKIRDNYVSSATTEGWIYDLELGVRGKFDFRLVVGNEVYIDDYKTGSVNGNIEKLGKWQRQAAIYTLISKRKEPEKSHTARIIASDGIFDVNTSTHDLKEIEKELLAQKAKWPVKPTSSNELAAPCSMCRQCAARHACPAYLSKTPWLNVPGIDSEEDQIWSWDVWGTVDRKSTSGREHSIVLETPNRRVIINGFKPLAGILKLPLSSRVGVFGVRRDKNYTNSRPVFRAVQKGLNAKTRILLKH